MVLARTVWLLAVVVVSLSFSVYAGSNCSAADATKNCVDGLLIPIWRPFLDLSMGDRFGRGLIYFVIIAYCFLGVSIIADRFMSSIEVITSQERTVTIKRPGLEPIKVTVRIWNETVSNLTLMALGSSAPEILLSIIEASRHITAMTYLSCRFSGLRQRLRGRRSWTKYDRRFGGVQSVHDHYDLCGGSSVYRASSSKAFGCIFCDGDMVGIRLYLDVSDSGCNHAGSD